MRILFSVALVAVLAMSVNFNANAQGSACSKGITTLPNGAYIYKNSAPVRSCASSPCPIVGFRIEPTLIGRSAQLNRGGTNIYDKNGTKIGSCPWASAHGEIGGRYRCTMNTGSLRRIAQQNTRSPEVYFTVPGGKCVKVPHAGKCYGSVKGKCTTTY